MSAPFDFEVQEGGSALKLILRGAVTVASASAIHERLVEALVVERDVVLSLDGVERLDGAGLQLVFALRTAVEQRGRRFAVVAKSGPARVAIELVGAERTLNIQEKE